MIGPRLPLLLGLLALTAACGGSTKEQKAKADMAVIERETAPGRLQQRGESAAMAGDFTRAEQYFVAAIKAGGDARLLTKRLIVICTNDSRYPAAASYGEDYLREHPSDTEVRYAVGTIYVALGDLPRATDDLTRVVAERPDIADAHYALASVLRQRGESLLDADHQLREYLRLDPQGQYGEAARASLLKSVP
jgi:Flp pilus assembly protein TadD